jgi:molecular chaperone IbpA
MRNNAFDFSPLFRTAVGFDRMTRALDSASRASEADLGYPPYNIEKLDDDRYRITMAIAGFSEADVEIVVQDDTLTVKGKAQEKSAEGGYLYRGIAARAFERRFQLADHILVSGATLENGILNVDLERQVPEEKKPRVIPIAGSSVKQVESQAA